MIKEFQQLQTFNNKINTISIKRCLIILRPPKSSERHRKILWHKEKLTTIFERFIPCSI